MQDLSQKNVTSLSQRCTDLITKAACIDKIKESYIDPILEHYAQSQVMLSRDPVKIAWSLIKQGGLLCSLLNKSQANTIEKFTPLPVPVDPSTWEDANAKANIKSFLDACTNALFYTSDVLFDANALFKDDSNALSKAIALTDKFFDKIGRIGRVNWAKKIEELRASDPLFALQPDEEISVTEPRLKVLKEMIDTEHQYMADLEKLQSYAAECRTDHVLPPKRLEAIFNNLDELADFQRKFSLQMESVLNREVLTDLQKSYGCGIHRLFIENEKAMAVYDQYCAKHESALEAVKQEAESLQAKKEVLEPTYVLPAYLIKPIQRLCKYPLLMRDLIEKSPKDAPDLADLELGLAAVKRVTANVNEIQRRAENKTAASELLGRVEDWKVGNDRIEKDRLGDLILYEQLPVMLKDKEKTFTFYAFQSHFLMVTEGKLTQRGKLVLKGALNWSDIHALQQVSATKLKVEYGDSFTIIFPNSEKYALWSQTLLKQCPAVDQVYGEGQAIPSKVPGVAPLPAKAGAARRRTVVSMYKGSDGQWVAPVAGAALVATAAVAGTAAAVGMAAGPQAAGAGGGKLTNPDDRPIKLKIVMGQETYLVQVREGDLYEITDVKRLITQKCKKDYERWGLIWDWPEEEMRLKYRDEQGDLINLQTELDLDQAIERDILIIYVLRDRIAKAQFLESTKQYK